MNLAIGSAFRDSSSRGQLSRWMMQIAALANRLHRDGHELSLILVEGDSVDDTRARLQNVAANYERATFVDVTHGKGNFGSTEDPARFAALAGVGNGILENIPDDADALLYVESDLIWSPTDVLGLVERLCEGVDIIAPMVWAGENFYDVFAYRALDGARFSPFPPFSHAIDRNKPINEIGSAGSCLVMRAQVARECRIPIEDGLVGFCRDARSKGYHVWVDQDKNVRHPA